jgi:hypothetical protein
MIEMHVLPPAITKLILRCLEIVCIIMMQKPGISPIRRKKNVLKLFLFLHDTLSCFSEGSQTNPTQRPVSIKRFPSQFASTY